MYYIHMRVTPNSEADGSGRKTSGLRVLGRIRLSKDADDTGTSIERQREAIEQWTLMHGHQLIGWAVDSGVSGSVSPFNTPELGPWLTPARLGDWDALVAYRLDRLSRRVIPLNELFGFILEHGKTLASVSESIDLSTWIGRLVANVIAGVAEGELEAIRARNQGSQKTVRWLGRWHGGTTPYGYRTDKRADGCYLVPDPAECRVIREEMLPRVLAHESTASIAAHLNKAGIPTRKGGLWQSVVIRQILRGKAVIGQHEHLGRVVTDGDGLPQQRAEPILALDEYEKVRECLAARSFRASQATFNPLAGVVDCHWCGSPLYFQAMNNTGKGKAAYYRCAKRGKGCAGLAVQADIVYELVEQHLLDSVRDVQRRERVFIPGRDKRQSVDDIEAAIAVCRRERDLGLYDGDDESYLTRLETLSKKRDELSMLPVSAGFEWKNLGETYGQAWERYNPEQRRAMLLDSKIKLSIGRRIGKELHWSVTLPEDIEELLGVR